MGIGVEAGMGWFGAILMLLSGVAARVGEVHGQAQRQGKGWGSVGARSGVFRAAAGGEPRVCEPNSVTRAPECTEEVRFVTTVGVFWYSEGAACDVSHVTVG